MDIKSLEQLESFRSLKGTTEEKITAAENALELTFAKDYHSYLKQYALASMNGHELTGIVASKRLNLADVTLRNRENNPDIPKNLYVLEHLYIDHAFAWQDEKGRVYRTIEASEPVKIFDSLSEYVAE